MGRRCISASGERTAPGFRELHGGPRLDVVKNVLEARIGIALPLLGRRPRQRLKRQCAVAAVEKRDFHGVKPIQQAAAAADSLAPAFIRPILFLERQKGGDRPEGRWA